PAGGEERSHYGEVSPGHPGLRTLAGRAGDQQRVERGVEGSSGGAGLRPRQHQRQALRTEQPAGVPGPRRLPGEIPEGPAATVPGRRPGTDEGGVPAPAGHGAPAGTGAAGPAGGSHGGHGHPGQRGAVSHGGGRPAGQGRDLPQGQDPHHPIAGKALPEAAPIRPKTKNRLRCNLSHQKRKRAGPPADLGGDEAAVRARRGGPAQGVPPQSAAPVCYGVLPDQPGHRQAGGPAGPQQ
ncbi:LIV-I protein F, partial [Dysosmobacter welbionis]